MMGVYTDLIDNAISKIYKPMANLVWVPRAENLCMTIIKVDTVIKVTSETINTTTLAITDCRVSVLISCINNENLLTSKCMNNFLFLTKSVITWY